MVRYGLVRDESIVSSSVLRAAQYLANEQLWWVGDASILPQIPFAVLVIPSSIFALPDHWCYGGPTIAYGPVGAMAGSLIRGSTDYLAEPWTTEELLLRVARCDASRVDRCGPVAFWGGVVTYQRRSIVCRPHVVQILRALAAANGTVVARQQLAQGGDADDSRAVDMSISRLRRCLRQLFVGGPAPFAVATVRGRGYRLVELPHVDNV